MPASTLAPTHDAVLLIDPAWRALCDVLDTAGALVPERFLELEARLIEEEAWAQLAAVYRLAIPRAPEPEFGRRLIGCAGWLALHEGERGRAIRAFSRVLASAPDQAEILQALAALMGEEGRLYEQARLLEALAELLAAGQPRAALSVPMGLLAGLTPPEPETAPEVLVDLAALLYPALGQAERALEALHYAYELDPGRPGVVRAAVRLLRRLRRWEQAKELLDLQVMALPPTDPSAPQLASEESAVARQRALAAAYLSLGESLLDEALHHGLAQDCLEQARALGQQDALSKLDELAYTKRAWEARAAALCEGAPAGDRAAAARAQVQAAQFYLVYGQDRLRAEAALERALTLVPGFLPAVDVLETSYLEHGHTEALLARLRQLLTTARAAPAKLGLLRRIADLIESELPEEPSEAQLSELRGVYEAQLEVSPELRPAAERLIELLAAEGRYTEQAELLRGLIERVEDPDRKVELHLQLGRLAVVRLGDEAEARSQLEAVLSIAPAHFEALHALQALYKDAGDDAQRLRVLGLRAESAPDLASRLAELRTQAELAKTVSEVERARLLRAVFDLEPTEAAREELEALAEQLGGYRGLARSLLMLATRSEGEAAVEAYARAAQLLEGKLPRPDGALAAYEAALALAPERADLQEAIDRLRAQEAEPAAQVEILRGQLEQSEAPATAQLQRRIARILDEQLDDLGGAAAALAAARAAQPEDPDILEQLADLYARQGEPEAQLGAIEALEGRTDAPAQLKLRRAQALAKLDRGAEAAALYLQVLALDEEQPEAIAGLRPLVGAGAPEAAAFALAKVYARRGQPKQQLAMLRQLAPGNAGAAAQASLLAEQLGDLPLAFELSAEALRADPSVSEQRQRSLRLAAQLGAHEDAAELLSSLLSASPAPPVRAALAVALGQIYDAQLGDADAAIAAYRQALEGEGEEAAAVAALRRLLSEQGRDGELVELLSGRLAVAETPAAKLQLGLELAALQEQLGEAEAAILSYRQLLSAAPQDPVASNKLSALLAEQGRHEEQLALLTQLSQATDDPVRAAEADARAGELAREALGDPEAALSHYQRALSAQPTQPIAMRGLEALLSETSVAGAAAAALEPAYAAQGDWARAAKLLTAQLEAATEAASKRQLGLRLAEVNAEGLGRPELGFRVLSAAFRNQILQPEDRPQLVALSRAAHQGEALAELFEAALEQDKSNAGLTRDLARLRSGPAAQPARARALWEALIELEPGDPEALEALEQLTVAGEEPGAWAAALAERVTADPAEALSDKKRAAEIYEEAAGDSAAAVELLSAARAQAPTDRALLTALARNLGALDRRQEQREVLGALVAQAEGPQAVARAERALAECCQEAGDPEAAVAALGRAVKAAPEQAEAREALEAQLEGPAGPQAAQALEPVFRAAGDWTRLAGAYEVLASATEDHEAKVERLVAIRSLYEDRLDDPEKAFEVATRAYKEAPDRTELLDALERLAEPAGALPELSRMVELQADRLPEGSPQRVEIRLRLADQAEKLLKDPARAVELYQRVLADAPASEPAAEALLRLYGEGGQASEQVAVLTHMAAQATEPAAQAMRLHQAAQLLEAPLNEPEEAIELYKQIRQIAPEDLEALVRLEGLYQASGANEALAEVYEAKAALQRGQDKCESLLSRGAVLEGQLAEPEAALSAYTEALALGAEAGEALPAAREAIDALMRAQREAQPALALMAAERVEPAWIEAGVWDKVRDTKLLRADQAEPEENKALRLEVVELLRDKLKDPQDALRTLCALHEAWPEDEALADRVIELAEGSGQEETLAGHLSAILPKVESDGLAVWLARKSAAIYEKIDRPELALPPYERLIEVDPTDLEALDALVRIYAEQGARADEARVLHIKLDAVDDPEDKWLIWGRLAELAAAEGDPDSELEAYRAQLMLQPDDVQTLRSSIRLAEQLGQVDALVEALEREVELVDSAEEKAEVQLRLAGVERRLRQDPAAGVERYAVALSLVQAQPVAMEELAGMVARGEAAPQAAAALAPVHRAQGAWQEYAECRQVELQGTEEPERRHALLTELSELNEERLIEPEAALDYAKQALEAMPLDAPSQARMERLFGQLSGPRELVAYYEGLREGGGAPEAGLFFARRAAQLWDQQLKDGEAAIEAYNKVLDRAPTDGEALAALERLYQEGGRFGSLAEVYEKRIAQAEEPALAASLMRQYARLQADQLKQPDGAIETLKKLLALAPDDEPALFKLTELCRAEGRDAELAELLGRAIERAPEDSQVALSARSSLAEIYAAEDRLPEAEALLAWALEREPTYPAARALLEDRFGRAVVDGEASLANRLGALLATAQRAAGQQDELWRNLKLRAEITEDPAVKAPLCAERAQLSEARERPEQAFEAYAELVAIAPEQAEARASLEALAEQLSLHEELADAYGAARARAEDPALRLELDRRRAVVLDTRCDDPEGAAEAWQQVLAAAPEDAEALEALDRLNLKLSRWAALSEILERRAAAVEGAERAGLCLRLAELWESQLSEPEEAKRWYRAAREADPEDRRPLSALARLLSPEGEAPELLGVLEALRALSEDEAWVELLSREAALLEAPLSEPQAAIQRWQDVLQLEPNKAEAFAGLERLYEAEGQWDPLVSLLNTELSAGPEPREKIRLQRQLGAVLGPRLGRVEEAVAAWDMVLADNPSDLGALSAMAETYRQHERWEELTSALTRQIPVQPDAAGVKALRLELGEVLSERLDRPEEAVEQGRRALEIDPHSPEDLARLLPLFEAAPEEQVRVVSLQAEQAPHPASQLELYLRMAHTQLETLQRRGGAIAAFSQAIGLQSKLQVAFEEPPPEGAAYPTLEAAREGVEEAYAGLSRIYQDNDDYQKLADLLNGRVNAAETEEERRRFLLSMAEIYDQHLSNRDLAFMTAVRAFEEGASEEALVAAERLASDDAEWDSLAEAIEDQLDEVDRGRAVELRCRLAQICLDKLEDPEPDRAEHQLQMALSMAPEHETARALLSRILGEAGRYEEVVDGLREQIEVTDDSDARLSLFMQLAYEQETHLEDVEAAIKSYKHILDVRPDHAGALSQLARIYQAQEDWQALLSVLRRQLGAADADEARLAARLSIARVWETGLKDDEQAIEAYAEVLRFTPEDAEALEAQERLFTRAARWGALVGNFEAQAAAAEQAGDIASAIERLHRAADVRVERFEDRAAAVAQMRRALALDPADASSRDRLIELLTEEEAWEPLIEQLHDKRAQTESRGEQVSLLVQIGRVYQDKLERFDDAEVAYQQALQIDPEAPSVEHAFGLLAERRGQWEDALGRIERELKLGGSGRELADLHVRAGRIQAAERGDPEAARAAYGEALSLDPGHLEALAALRQLHVEADEPAEVVKLLSQEAGYTEDADKKAALYSEAAAISLARFDDRAAAKKSYQQALEAVPDHAPALRAVSELYFEDQEYEPAEKRLLTLLMDLDREADAVEMSRGYYRLAYIAEHNGDEALALQRYQDSYKLDGSYLPTLEGLASALERVERWDEAEGILRNILVQHRDSLTDAEVVDAYHRLGELEWKLGNLSRARAHFERALSMSARHTPSLSDGAELAEQMEEWERAYDLRDRLIQGLEGQERFDAVMRQAKLCDERIKEPYRAIDAYSEAHRMLPRDRDVLKALVRLFRDTNQVGRAIEAQTELAKCTENPASRRAVWMNLATLHASHGETEQTLRALNQALDADPGHLQAFQHIEHILGEAGDFKSLEQNYHAMIRRVPRADKARRMVLWRSLAELYEGPLQDRRGAQEAYEVILKKFNPEDHATALKLADLYADDPEKLSQALEMYHKLLPEAVDPALVARKLANIYLERQDWDRAYCALGALVLMQVVSEDELATYQKLQSFLPKAEPKPLTDVLWRDLVLHKSARSPLGLLLSVLYRGAPDLFAAKQQRLGLKKKERVEVDRGRRARLRYFAVWKKLAAAMNVGPMAHYNRPNSAEPPRIYPGREVVLFAGENNAIFRPVTEERLVRWQLARQLATARPELAALQALPPEDIGAAMEAAIRLFVPEGSGIELARLNIDPQLVDQWQRALPRYLNPEIQRTLRDVVSETLQTRAMKRTRAFLEGAEHSASRAALLMVGDALAAQKGLLEGDALIAMKAKKRVRALMLFMLSEEHFRLRETLGLAVSIEG